MKKILMALAATSLMAMPAAANHSNKGGNGGKVGQNLKVCLVTFDDDGGNFYTDVTKAQYVPLTIALKLAQRIDRYTINTYGPNGGTATGVMSANVQVAYAPYGITGMQDTETVCNILAEEADDDMDRDDD